MPVPARTMRRLHNNLGLRINRFSLVKAVLPLLDTLHAKAQNLHPVRGCVMIKELVTFFLKIWVFFGTLYLAVIVLDQYSLVPPPPAKWVAELRNARELVDEANKLADKAQPVAKAVSDVSNAVTAPLQLLTQVLRAIPSTSPGAGGVRQAKDLPIAPPGLTSPPGTSGGSTNPPPSILRPHIPDPSRGMLRPPRFW